jgi:hypothetical protein
MPCACEYLSIGAARSGAVGVRRNAGRTGDCSRGDPQSSSIHCAKTGARSQLVARIHVNCGVLTALVMP